MLPPARRSRRGGRLWAIPCVAAACAGLFGAGTATSAGASPAVGSGGGVNPAAEAKAASTPPSSRVTVQAGPRSPERSPVTTGLPGGAWQGLGVNWNGVPYRRVRSGPVTNGHRGLGDPYSWVALPWSEERGQLLVDESRLLALRPAYVRMSWAADWFAPRYRPGHYRWNSTAMADRRQVLTFLYRHHVPVVASMWAPPPHAAAYGSPAWNRLETDLATHLVKTWGFTNIRYWIPVNEPDDPHCPNGCSIDMDHWIAGTRRLHGAFVAAGLLPGLQLMGPTVSSEHWAGWPNGRHPVRDWPTTLARSGLLHSLGAVDWHEYLWVGPPGQPPTGTEAWRGLRDRPVGEETAQIVRQLAAGSDRGVTTFVSEFGFASMDQSTHVGVPSTAYAMAMLDFSSAIARAGVSAASLWELDPDIPGLRIASDGLWRSTAPYWTYPVFAAAQLLGRVLPPGAVIEPVSVAAGRNLTVLATRVPSADAPPWSGPQPPPGAAQHPASPNAGAWSVLLVNNGSKRDVVHVRGLSGAGRLDLYRLGPSAVGVRRTGVAVVAPSGAIGATRGAVSLAVPGGAAALLVG